jgi:hypothetical protein
MVQGLLETMDSSLAGWLSTPCHATALCVKAPASVLCRRFWHMGAGQPVAGIHATAASRCMHVACLLQLVAAATGAVVCSLPAANG